MASSQDAQEILRGRAILIVEDDVGLAGQLATLFRGYTGVEPMMAHHMDEARQLIRSGKDADLAVIDTMLPGSKADFERIQEFDKKAAQLRDKVIAYGERGADENEADLEADEARQKLAHVLRQIQELIVLEGGIQLVKDWLATFGEGMFPVLYLSAIGQQDVIRRASRMAGLRSRWLVKPVPTDLIIAEARGLLKPPSQTGESN